MSLEAMHDEIMNRFRDNLKHVIETAENGMVKTTRLYFSDYYPVDDGLSIYAFEVEDIAKRVVKDYNDSCRGDGYSKEELDNNYSSIHIADVPEDFMQPYIEGLDANEMEAVATMRGKPFYAPDNHVWRMTYRYDEELRKEARKLLVSDVEEIPFRPVIILKKIKFIENN